MKELKNVLVQLFGETAEGEFTKDNGWTFLFSAGNTKRRVERVQAWVSENGNVDLYIGHNTAWYQQYKRQIENAYSVCPHSVHAKGSEVVLRFSSVDSAVKVLSTWKQRYGVADVKNAVKDSEKANSVKTA